MWKPSTRSVWSFCACTCMYTHKYPGIHPHIDTLPYTWVALHNWYPKHPNQNHWVPGQIAWCFTLWAQPPWPGHTWQALAVSTSSAWQPIENQLPVSTSSLGDKVSSRVVVKINQDLYNLHHSIVGQSAVSAAHVITHDDVRIMIPKTWAMALPT